MPSSRTVVQIFVSSPSDVAEEREALETIVTELNRTWSGPMGVLLELVRWETHTHPAFASDAQAAINHQIGDEYDVFLGILWASFRDTNSSGILRNRGRIFACAHTSPA
jgi:hypothetical protein